MIEKMEKLFVYGLTQETPSLMKDLMKCGCLEITDPRELCTSEEEMPFTEKASKNLYDVEQMANRISATLGTLSPYIESKGFLAPLPDVSFVELESKETRENALAVCDKVELVIKELAELKSTQGRVTFLKDSLVPWLVYDAPLNAEALKTCTVQLMTIPAIVSLEEVESKLKAENVLGVVNKVSGDKDFHYVSLLAHNDSFVQGEEILRQNGGSRINFSELAGTATQETENCSSQLTELAKQISEKEKVFESYGKEADLLRQALDGLNVEADCERAGQTMLHSETVGLIGAWIPVDKKPDIEKVLEKFSCYYEFQEPANIEETPVLLKNGKIVANFEVVTEMYSLPASTGYDPNAAMAPFFWIFFGMMLSDAGYGLLLVIGGFMGAKLMNGNKLLKMLGYCGISTMIWGFIYGGFFGDALSQIAATFFNTEFTMPALIDPLADPMTILIMSFAFGAVHLFVGMGIKAYILISRGRALDALFDVGFWYCVLIGLPLLLVGGTVGQVGTYLAIAGAIGLVLTQGRDKKNVVMKFLSGVLSLYDITGYFSDVLSYSRIMALGLATGVIATVINTMGSMGGGGIVGFIMFTLVFVFGHLLNLAINALGSYVHTSRLQYVEFFGKFFEGGGKAFSPLRINTQYVNVNKQEEI